MVSDKLDTIHLCNQRRYKGKKIYHSWVFVWTLCFFFVWFNFSNLFESVIIYIRMFVFDIIIPQGKTTDFKIRARSNRNGFPLFFVCDWCHHHLLLALNIFKLYFYRYFGNYTENIAFTITNVRNVLALFDFFAILSHIFYNHYNHIHTN